MWGSCRDVDSTHRCGVHNTTRFISRLLKHVNPDFVVVTGDLVFGPRSPVSTLNAVLLPIDHSGIPYATVQGNHDVQRCGAWDQQQFSSHLQKRATLHGTSRLMVGNTLCVLMVDYSYTHAGHVDPAHLAWIGNASGCLDTRASLVFTHVPVAPLTGELVGSLNEPINWLEGPTQFMQTLQLLPSLYAVGFGHDHVNTACGTMSGNLTGCYAGSAGYTAYGKRGIPRQARVYEWDTNDMITYRVLDGDVLKNVGHQQLHY